jgi:uncharacterized protein YndB with AHSA1/START domain
MNPTDTQRDLTITRLIDAPPARLFAAWTQPALLARWFAPKPWGVARASLDPRPGGEFLVVMRGPDGTEMPCPGVFLDVIPDRRIVMTDAYTAGWRPSMKPFLTTVITLEDQGGRTRYVAQARHWSVADREAHEKMGFETGWSQCLDQLVELLKVPFA